MGQVTRTWQGLTGQRILTNTQIKLLPTTGSPLTIVPAPGVGRVIVPIAIELSLSPWVADYVVDAGATIVVKIGAIDIRAGLAGGNVFEPDNLLKLGEASYLFGVPFATNVQPSFKLADYANLPLTVTFTNAAAGPFTGGDATNLLTVLAYYNVFRAGV